MHRGAAGQEVLEHWLIAKRWRGEKPPPSSLSDEAVDWPATIRAASEDFAVTALATLLDEAALLVRVPSDVHRFLRYALAQNAEANRRICEQCVEIGSALSKRGLSGVLLKGAAWLFEPGPAAKDRMLRDVDILVPRPALEDARASLETLGYAPALAVLAEDGHVHDRPLEHPVRPARIELHVDVTARVKYLGANEVFGQARAAAPGLLVPAPLHRMIHNVVHAQIINGDFVSGALNLRDSLDPGRLLRSNVATEDWFAVADETRRRGFFRALSGALHKAAYVSGADLPEPFRSDLSGRRHLQRCLRQRRWRPVDMAMRKFGVFCRAMAWERDAYPLRLGDACGLYAHFLVNRRRLGRIGAALKRNLKSA